MSMKPFLEAYTTACQRIGGYLATITPTLATTEQEDDTIILGGWSVRQYETDVSKKTLDEWRTFPVTHYEVAVEVRRWSYHWGEDGDYQVIATKQSPWEALIEVHIAEERARLGNLMEYLIPDIYPETEEV